MNHLNSETIFRAPNVYSWGGGFDLSPDGQTIVFMWNKTGHWELYRMPLPGGPALPLTSSAESKMCPRYSPDGKTIAFLQDYAGDEKFDLHLLDPASGRITNLMPETDEGLNEFIRWSPDGRWLYYTSNREGAFATYAISIEGGPPRRLTRHDFSDILVEPSPDGQWLAVMSLLDGQNLGIFLVPAAGGPEIRLGFDQGLRTAEAPAWSPDSTRLAFASADQKMSDIGVYDLRTQSIEWITASDCEYYAPSWSPIDDRLLYLISREGNLDLGLYDPAHGAEILPTPAGLHTQARFTRDGRSVICTYAGPAHPPDLWSISLADRTATQLTDSLPAGIDRSLFVAPTHVWYPSLDANIQVPALLYKPRNLPADHKPPAVLYVHGGPTAQHDNDWYPDVQDWVRRGYVVLCPNYRGSTGYGRAHREANRFDLGRGDTNDVAAGADYLIEQGLADPQRIAITGISYGGFMTMTCVTRYPDKWAAGSALVPFVNWFTEHANEREDLQYWDDQNMGDPVKDYDRWYANSPIFFIDRITAPIQLFAGAHDPRCPLTESEQVRDELVKLGRPVELHVYQDEGHGYRKLDNRVETYRRRAAFLDRYLKA